jgi:hypothetical protein
LTDIFLVPSLAGLLNKAREGFIMGTVAARGTSRQNEFDVVAEPFLQREGLPFAEVLDAASIRRVFREEEALFGQDDLFSTEIVLWATKAAKGSPHRYTFNYDAMRSDNGGRQMKNVWRIRAVGRAEKAHGKHPTQKPVALIDRCLRASTQPGDRVLDPFAGSASAGIAALQLGRTFTGCERERGFIDIAVRRLAVADAALPG